MDFIKKMYYPKSDMLQLIELEALLKQIYQDTSLHYANDVDCGACYIVIYECVKALVAVRTSLSQFLIPKVFIVWTPAACRSLKLHIRHLKPFLCFHIHISGGIQLILRYNVIAFYSFSV